ncbi:hypothetical protein ACUXST_002548 [Sphingomonas sp. F9_3S_D5_B_2]
MRYHQQEKAARQADLTNGTEPLLFRWAAMVTRQDLNGI